MSLEGKLLDRNSLRSVTGKTADWSGLSRSTAALVKRLRASGRARCWGAGDGTSYPHGRELERRTVFSRRVGFWTGWPVILLVRPDSFP